MGANTPKSELDERYRVLVADFLGAVMKRNELNKTQLAEALGVDRSIASRYLSRDVRAPLQRLSFLYRSIREPVPREIEDAFWDSEAPATTQRRRA